MNQPINQHRRMLAYDSDPNRKAPKMSKHAPTRPKSVMIDCPQCPTRFNKETHEPVSFRAFKGIDALRKHVKEVHTHAVPLSPTTPKGEQKGLGDSLTPYIED